MAQLASVVLTALSLKFFRPVAHCSIVALMLLSKCRTEYTSSKLPKRQQKWFYNSYNSKTKHKGRPNRVDSLFFYHYPFFVTYPRTELVSADGTAYDPYRQAATAAKTHVTARRTAKAVRCDVYATRPKATDV